MSQTISLQQYLKVYSSINTKFIDDFFSLYKIDTVDTDFVIDLDTVVKWLNSYKRNLKTTLSDSYKLM